MQSLENKIQEMLYSKEIEKWKAENVKLLESEELRIILKTKTEKLNNQIEELKNLIDVTNEKNDKKLKKIKNTFFKINLAKNLSNLNKKDVELCDNIEILEDLEKQKEKLEKILGNKSDKILREKEQQVWKLILTLYFSNKNDKVIDVEHYQEWNTNFIKVCKKIKTQIEDINLIENINIISDITNTLITDIKRDSCFLEEQKISFSNLEHINNLETSLQLSVKSLILK